MTTILAVDDSATMRKCLEITFQGTGINLVSCASASEALAKVKALTPDLVIADVSLPPSDGYDLCATIKLTAPTTPVLMLSSKQSPFDPSRGAKADAHMDKPFDTQQLIDKARELMGAAPQRRAQTDTDVPGLAEHHRVATTPSPRPVTMPERGAPQGAFIPPPGQRRPTPAMVPQVPTPIPAPSPTPSPIPTPAPSPPGVAAQAARPRPDAARKTVPFAIPSPLAAKGTAPGMPAMPGPDEGLSKTMAFPGKMEAAVAQALQQEIGPPRQATQPGPSARTTAVSGTPPMERTGTMPGVRLSDEPTPPRESSRPANGGDFEGRLAALGLSPDQVAGVLALSREVIEQVVWEVVPTLAETIIKEELRRLTER